MAGPTISDLYWSQQTLEKRVDRVERDVAHERDRIDEFKPDAVVERLDTLTDDMRWQKRFLIGSVAAILLAVITQNFL